MPLSLQQLLPSISLVKVSNLSIALDRGCLVSYIFEHFIGKEKEEKIQRGFCTQIFSAQLAILQKWFELIWVDKRPMESIFLFVVPNVADISITSL